MPRVKTGSSFLCKILSVYGIALWISDEWNQMYESLIHSEEAGLRRHAIYGRSRAVITFDRVLNGELVK